MSLLVSQFGRAEFDLPLLETNSVRVVVRGDGKAHAASGFLWQNANQVVTSLHALSPNSSIIIQCQGVSKLAQLSKVYARADLALLKVNGLPTACKPITKLNKQAPLPDSNLYTFGYHAGAKSGTSRAIKKGFASVERLGALVNGNPLRALRAIGVPAVDLDIYYVQGGLLPGYSGAPVINVDNELIGIVDGGLNSGQASYNWLIPASNLDELLTSDEDAIPQGVAELASSHFSSGLLEADLQTIIEYDHNDQHYRWIHTKSLNLMDIVRESIESPEITAGQHSGSTLLDKLGAQVLMPLIIETGPVDFSMIELDVYEELDLGLIVAFPSGLEFQTRNAGRGLGLPRQYQPSIASTFRSHRKAFAYSAYSHTAPVRNPPIVSPPEDPRDEVEIWLDIKDSHHSAAMVQTLAADAKYLPRLSSTILKECNERNRGRCVRTSVYDIKIRHENECGDEKIIGRTRFLGIAIKDADLENTIEHLVYNLSTMDDEQFVSFASVRGLAKMGSSTLKDSCANDRRGRECKNYELWKTAVGYFASVGLTLSRNTILPPRKQQLPLVCDAIDELFQLDSDIF